MGRRTPSVNQVKEFIEYTQERMAREIADYLLPLLMDELKKVNKKNPSVSGVLFGNGEFYIETPERGLFKTWWDRESCPDYARRLWDLCDLACGPGRQYMFVSGNISLHKEQSSERLL